MKVEEGCGCGAALSIDGVSGLAAAMAYVTAWRGNHKHNEMKQTTRAIGFAMPVPNEDDD